MTEEKSHAPLSFKKKVAQGFLWLSTGTFGVQLISWLATIVVIRLLSPTDYGLMAMAATIISFLLMVSDLGLGAAIIQTESISRYQLRQMLGFILSINVVILTLTLFSAPLVALFFHEPKVADITRCLSLNYVLLTFYIIPQSLCVREMDFKTKAKVDLIARLAACFITLVLAVKGFGVWSLVLGEIGLHFTKAIGFNIARPSILWPVFRMKGSEQLIRFGSFLTLDRVLYWAYTQADIVIVGRLLGKEALGIYAIALNLASIPMDKFLPVITQVTFSAYSRIQNNIRKLKAALLNTTHVVAFFAFPLFWGMMTIAAEGIPLILGAKWQAVVVPFQLLCIILPLKALGGVLPPALFAIGRPMTNVVNMAISVLVMSMAFLVGARAGLMGICLAWIIAYPAVFIIISMRALKALTVPFENMLRELMFPAAASILMVGAVFAARYLFAYIPPLPSLAIYILVGMLSFTAATMLHKSEYGRIKSILFK